MGWSVGHSRVRGQSGFLRHDIPHFGGLPALYWARGCSYSEPINLQGIVDSVFFFWFFLEKKHMVFWKVVIMCIVCLLGWHINYNLWENAQWLFVLSTVQRSSLVDPELSWSPSGLVWPQRESAQQLDEWKLHSFHSGWVYFHHARLF